MDRVLFGDNQFFGVNHMSEEKARAQSMRFQDLDAIIAVLDAAYEEGIRTFMCTSHDRVALDLRSLPRASREVPRLPLLSVHAVRAQVRQRRHRARDDRGAAHVPAAGRRDGGDAQGRRRAREQGHRGDHAVADRRRDEDVPRPEHAGRLHAERHHRPAARPAHERRASASSTTTCAPGTAPSPATSR